jgi:OmpA-OmpF porin, OOP family
MSESRFSSSTLRAVATAAFAAPFLLTQAALAQEPLTGGFALDRYEPTVVGDRFFAVPGGGVDGKNTFRFGLSLEYAHDPLVIRDTCVDGNNNGTIEGDTECNVDDPEELASVVEHQMTAHVGLSYALFDRLLLSMSVPLHILNKGDSVTNPRSPTSEIAAPDGAAVGDLRFGARVKLLGKTNGPAELGLGAYFWVPTGSEEDFTGDPSVRFMPHLALSGKLGKIVYGAQGGVTFREGVSYVNVNTGHELTYGAALGVLLARDMLQIGPEFYGSSTFGNETSIFKGRTTHAELLGGIKFLKGDFYAGVAAGPGLSHGMGTPQVRVIGTIGFSPAPADSDGDGIPDRDDACPKAPGQPSSDPKKNGCPPDQDNDGIVDTLDACPTVPGQPNPDPGKNGCPPDRDGDGVFDPVDACPDVPGAPNADPAKNGCPADRDGDTVPDNVDACPDVPGVPNNQDPKKNGCPPDRDGDGVADPQDACPDVPGVPSQDPAQNGCPGDRDGDTIRDDQDACPNEKGAPDPDPKQNGCPKLVRVTAGQIKILQQIQFAFGRADILPASDALLTEVAAVLKDHPEIKKVRVDGHTDDVGPDAVNMKLSAERARSAKLWLVDHGVEEARLDSAGFGEASPIADNKTDAGRQQNRRSEFRIIDPAPPANEAAPVPPPQPTLPPPAKKKAAPAGGGAKPAPAAPAAGGGAKPPAPAPAAAAPAGGAAKPAAGAPAPGAPGAGAAPAAKPAAAPAAGQSAPKKP